MSEAPERIWLIETDKYNPYRVSFSLRLTAHSPDESTEYVRADRIGVLEREVKDARQRAIDNGKWLGELLAVIHLDGGHYQALHRDEKSVEDAIAIVQAAEADKARLSEALRPFADMADYLDSETEGFADTDEFDLLYEDHLFHHFKVADFRAARAALSGSSSGWPVPDGWKLVPVEPTDEMLRAGQIAADDHRWKWCGYGLRKEGEGLDGMLFHVREAYRAMLPAAPQQGGE